MLALPKGKLTLKERVFIKRSNLVLRGAGLGQTVLYVPKSEPSMPAPGSEQHLAYEPRLACPGG